MPFALILLFGSWISLIDFTRHIIPNRSLLYLALSVSMYLTINGALGRHALFAGKIFVVLMIVNWLSAGVVGMGDLKYLLVLSFISGNKITFSRGAIFSTGFAFAWGLIVLLKTRTLASSIPLAPSITAGYLVAMAT